MKGLRKQFIAAIAMTLVAAIALGSSTFAWFANNATVNATGMAMTAKSDVGYMLICQGHRDLAYVKANGKTSVTFATSNVALYPAKHDISTPSNIAEYDKASNWYYERAASPGSSTAKSGTKTTITPTQMDNYVLVNEFSICAQSGSSGLENVKISDLDFGTTDNAAGKVVVASSTASDEFTIGDNQSSSVVLDSLVTDTAVTYIKVYAYWDGSHSDVYTQNFSNLKETTLSFALTGTPKDKTNP